MAPPQEPVVEPYSPFSPTFTTPVDDNAFRSMYLTPPPTLAKFNKGAKPLSPLRPSDGDTAPAQGLDRERFEALLHAAKERNLALGSKKGCSLRKEITLKAHKNKQVERRALFLSKVLAPPSPTATLTPKTPPESPAIFHYSLPSPGLVSPLALFESLSEDAKHDPLSYSHEPWVEQVDFRTSQHAKVQETSSRVRPPSLDQISARITSRTHARSHVNEVPAVISYPTATPDRPRLQVGVGRLQMPIRADPLHTLPSNSRKPLDTLELRVKAIMAHPTQSNSREHRAHNMLSTLRRRMGSFECRLDGVEPEAAARGVKWKRHSAPGDLLPLRERSGFEHPVLGLPGGF
ncbi:hypothetical protein C0995_002552 [Termitomyces sp. Mi166|nr:hypothetical protein C0995_002552 [Termitomyces sp. Mi166\